MAQKDRSSFTLIPEVSRQTRVPGPYVSKIFRCLVERGILESRRGPRGGFGFKENPGTVTLKDVMAAIDDRSRMDDCVMGLDACSAANACPLHAVWAESKKQILERLEQETLLSVKKVLRKGRYRNFRRSFLNIPMNSASGRNGAGSLKR